MPHPTRVRISLAAGGALALLVGACSSPRPSATAGPRAAAVRPAPTGALAAGELDDLLRARWQDARVVPAPDADEGELLRRLSLDLVGRPPTLAETTAYLADRAPDKRARATERLLASPAFAERWADVYSGLLFGADARRKLVKQLDPRELLVRAFAENRPYDQLARAMVTATGSSHDSPELAFIAARLRGGGGAEAVAGATARVFLGLQIQCAQCHDHPYDPRWKQEDFYGLVAYFARTKARNDKMAMDGPAVSLVDVRRGEATFRKPRTESDVTVAPRFPGAAVPPRPEETRRETLARALVGSDLFAKAMVARTWAQLFGRGIVDPWDDLGAPNDPKHPRALVRLAEDFRASGFDFKHLLRVITASVAYGRSSRPAPGAPDDGGAAVRAFARAGVRPLSTEQLFATLVTTTGADEMLRRGRDEEAADKRLKGALREYAQVFADDDEAAAVDVFDGSVPQALLLWNGELTNAVARPRGRRATATPPEADAAPPAFGAAGVLSRILAERPTPAARLDALFLAVLSRPPTAEEAAWLLPTLAPQDRAAWEDLHFALVTSSESVTNH